MFLNQLLYDSIHEMDSNIIILAYQRNWDHTCKQRGQWGSGHLLINYIYNIRYKCISIIALLNWQIYIYSVWIFIILHVYNMKQL